MSTYEYPPTSLDTVKIEQLLQIYDTMINDKSAIYISTPMTSGLLYMNAYAELSENERKGGLTKDVNKNLFNKNCQHARSVVAMTRLHFPTSIVIDPTKIAIDGWSQNDYLTFWKQVIIKYAQVIRFVNDWYYSNGCAYEFLVGAITNKVMIDEDENTLHPLKGRELIQKAYDEHLKNGYDNLFLKNIISSLDKNIEDDGA